MIKQYLGRKWQLLTCIFLVSVLLSSLGIQVTDRASLGDRTGIGIGVGLEKVITLGHVAYAAGDVDYTYDGVDDNVQFQAALNALPATGGRLVDVSAVQKNFGAVVTRAVANVTIIGSGKGSYFVNDGITALFTAGGNGWKFQDLRTDAGGINMGATTGWQWLFVDNGSTVYDYRSPAGSIVNGSFTASSITDTGLTSNRVPYAGVGGLLGDSSNLTFDGTSLQVSSANVTRSATYVVAASNAPAHVKAQADYVSDNISDNVEIQAAIDALTAGRTWKETVKCIGSFTIAATLNLASYTILDLTEAKITSSIATSDILISASAKNYVEILGGLLIGDGGTGASEAGIYLNDVDNFLVADTIINDVYNVGVAIAGGSARGSIRGVWVNAASSWGISVGSSSDIGVSDSVVTSSVGGVNFTYGAARGIATNNRTVSINGTAYGFGQSTDSAFIANEDYGSVTSFNAGTSGGNPAIRPTFINNVSNAATGNAFRSEVDYTIMYGNKVINPSLSGLYLTNASYCDVQNNLFLDNQGIPTMDRGITESGTSDYNTFKNNRIDGFQTAAAQFVGANSVVKGNIGYVTENYGASVGTGVQQTIAHGLSFTPVKSQIGVWSDNATAWVWQSANPDATNIYVTDNTSGSAWHWGTIGN